MRKPEALTFDFLIELILRNFHVYLAILNSRLSFVSLFAVRLLKSLERNFSNRY